MEYVVLGLLMIQRMTLYEMNRAFKGGISMIYSASYGSLQIAVRNLLRKSLIVFEQVVEGGRNKKVYSITPSGAEAFSRWMQDEIPHNKVEVTALSKVFFLGLIQDNGQKKQIVKEILAKIRMIEGELHNMQESFRNVEVPKSLREISRYSRKTLEYGLGAHAFAREWAEGILRELEEDAENAAGGQE